MSLLTRLVFLVLAVVVSAYDAFAQETYPNKPITWILGFGAGGIADNSSRIVARALSQKLGQPVLIDNRPGAAGILGAEVVAQAKPDGYTMLFASQGQMATYPYLYKKLSYDASTSFVPVHGFAASSLLMAVNASAPYKTLEQFIDHARNNPGKINFGSQGVGTSTHLLGEMLQMATGITMLHVPYKQPTSLYTDLISGTVDVIFDFSVVIRPNIEAGKLRALAVSQADRLKNFPDVPTFKERGIDVEMTAWSSLAMPAGTPPHVVSRMSDAMAEASRHPDVLKYYEENDTGNLGHLGPKELDAFYVSEREKFKKIIEKIGITLD